MSSRDKYKLDLVLSLKLCWGVSVMRLPLSFDFAVKMSTSSSVSASFKLNINNTLLEILGSITHYVIQ